MRIRLLSGVFAGYALQINAAGGAAGADASRGPLDVILMAAGIAVVLAVLIYCIKCFIRPGEKDTEHIKRRILRDDG